MDSSLALRKSVNPAVIGAQYAVRGELVLRAAEMQKQLDSMAKSGRTVARFTGFAMSEMDALSPPLMSLTQHRDRYEVHFPSLMMRDLVTKRDSRIYRAPGDAPYPVVPPKPGRPTTATGWCVWLCHVLGALAMGLG